MQFVSGLPATGILPASQRETPAEIATPSPTRVVSATSQPVMASAVVQPHTTERSAAVFRKRASSTPGQKAVLTGPPPAFQISLLQHIRETRADPEPLFPPDKTDEGEAALTAVKPTDNTAPQHAASSLSDAESNALSTPRQGKTDKAIPSGSAVQDWPDTVSVTSPTRRLDLAL